MGHSILSTIVGTHQFLVNKVLITRLLDKLRVTSKFVHVLLVVGGDEISHRARVVFPRLSTISISA